MNILTNVSLTIKKTSGHASKAAQWIETLAANPDISITHGVEGEN